VHWERKGSNPMQIYLSIFNKMKRVLHRTSKEELPHHKSEGLEGGTDTHTANNLVYG